MNKSDFVLNYLEFSKEAGFSFLSENEEFSGTKPMSTGKQALFAGIMSAGLVATFGGGAIVGAIAGSNVSFSDHKKDEVVTDLKSLNPYCDLVGMNVSNGACQIRLLIDGDELNDETLIGRFALIHERAETFRKYSMVLMKNWIWGDSTAGTIAEVVVLFSLHKKAREVIQRCSDKLRHTSMRKQVYTHPYIVDLEDEELTVINNPFIKLSPGKTKAAFFKRRVSQSAKQTT